MKLGDYIHLKYSNYKNYGITREGNGQSMSGAKLLQEMRRATLKSIPVVSMNEVIHAETVLNYFYSESHDWTGKELTGVDRQQIISVLTEIMSDQGKKMAGLSINPETLAVTDQGYKVNQMSKIGKGSKTTLNAVFSRIEELVLRRNSLLNNPFDQELLEKLNNFLFQFEKNNNKLMNDLRNSAKQHPYARLMIQDLPQRSNQLISDNNVISRSFIDDLNNLMTLSATTSSAILAGDVAEYVTAIMPYMYENCIKGNVQNLKKIFANKLESAVTGQSRTAKILVDKNVYAVHEVEKNAQSHWQKIGKKGEVAYVNTTQDKIDVQINLGTNQQPLLASVKNYAYGTSSIHLLRGTSLLKYLQLYPELGNHYLNITANQRINSDGQSSADVAPMVDVVSAHKAMLVALGTHALAGGLYGKQTGGQIQKLGAAHVLVVNWRRNKKGKSQFRVYPIRDLLDHVEQIMDFDNLNATTIWQNEYKVADSGEYARCIDILKQLHVQKLNVSLRASALKRR